MTHGADIQKRAFIVGCSRSGTTVLQVAVASHSRMASFPETFFFLRLPGRLGRPGVWLGLPSERARPALEEAFDRLGIADSDRPRPDAWGVRPYIDTYLEVLDATAQEAGADMWVEKTPQHIYRLGSILRYVPQAHIIHMIRDGRDVVASTCDRARTYPDRFDSRQQEPPFAIGRWNRALRTARTYLGAPGHTFVVYENFVQHPERALRRICRDLGIDFEPQMVEGDEDAAASVIPDGKDWLSGAKGPPKQQASKFDRLFSPSEQADIEDRLRLDIYDHIVERVGGE